MSSVFGSGQSIRATASRRYRAAGDARSAAGISRGIRGAAALLALIVFLAAAPASADRYDSKSAGFPLRFVAYALHPVGVAIDYLIMRPAHWLVMHEPAKTIFGHTD